LSELNYFAFIFSFCWSSQILPSVYPNCLTVSRLALEPLNTKMRVMVIG